LNQCGAARRCCNTQKPNDTISDRIVHGRLAGHLPCKYHNSKLRALSSAYGRYGQPEWRVSNRAHSESIRTTQRVFPNINLLDLAAPPSNWPNSAMDVGVSAPIPRNRSEVCAGRRM
jgi:hypothetical protein